MRFKKGSKVEVLSKKEVPSGSWRCAEIISGNGHNYTVRYDGYEGAKNVILVERVSEKAIRPCPPSLEISVNWVRGDVVEVFDNCSWKMAIVSQVLGQNFFLVRLLGSSLEFEVFKFDIRARQSWQGDKWVVVGKGSVSFDHGRHDENLALQGNRNLSYRYHKTNTRVNLKAEDDHFLVKNKVNIQESHVVSSKTLKRGSPYCYSQVEAYAGVNQKFRAIEKEDKCHWVKAANSSTLPETLDAVAFQGDMLGEKYKNASSNNRTTGLSEVEVERRRPTGTVGCSLANLESNDADSVTCSVGSCSITSNSSYKIPHVSAGHIKDDGGNSSDAESFCEWAYEEGNSLPTKEELADEIHRLELHAYRCTIEALHASGPLSWEREELVTNLRLSLHISNDEHLMELRNLGSTHTSIPIR